MAWASRPVGLPLSRNPLPAAPPAPARPYYELELHPRPFAPASRGRRGVCRPRPRAPPRAPSGRCLPAPAPQRRRAAARVTPCRRRQLPAPRRAPRRLAALLGGRFLAFWALLTAPGRRALPGVSGGWGAGGLAPRPGRDGPRRDLGPGAAAGGDANGGCTDGARGAGDAQWAQTQRGDGRGTDGARGAATTGGGHGGGGAAMVRARAGGGGPLRAAAPGDRGNTRVGVWGDEAGRVDG
jgi:hypothetical protein